MKTNTIKNQYSQVARHFVEAQIIFGILPAVLFVYQDRYVLVGAVLVALVMQWVQLYFLLRPSRVSKINKWVGAMLAGALLRYLVFIAFLVLLFSGAAFEQDLIKTGTNGWFLIFLVLGGVYCGPYWYSGMRQSSKVKSRVINV